MRSVLVLAIILLLGAVPAACGGSSPEPTATPTAAAKAPASPTPQATQTPGTATSEQLAFSGLVGATPASAVYLAGSDGTGLSVAWTWETAGSHTVYLAWSPDGRQLTFFGHDAGVGSAGLYLLDIAQGSVTRLLDVGWMSGPPVWSPDGSRLYVDLPPTRLGNGGLWAVPVDGSAAPTLLAPAPEIGTPLIPSPDGQKIAVMSGFPPKLALMSVDDSELRVVAGELTISSGNLPAWSPDSRQIAFIGSPPSSQPNEPAPGQLYVVNTDGTGLAQLTDHQPPHAVASGFPATDPVWSPDGQQIAYTVIHAATPAMQQQDVYLASADGSGVRNLTDDPERADTGPSWSPDGREIAVLSQPAESFRNPDGGASSADIRVIMADGTDPRTVVAGVQSVQFEPFMMEMIGLPEWRPAAP